MRPAGQTKAMVESLPDDGRQVVVVVHSRGMADYLRAMIHDLRGARLLANTRVIVGQTRHDNWLRGWRMDPNRLFVDHAVPHEVQRFIDRRLAVFTRAVA